MCITTPGFYTGVGGKHRSACLHNKHFIELSLQPHLNYVDISKCLERIYLRVLAVERRCHPVNLSERKVPFPVCLVGVIARKPGGHDSQLVEASIETFPEIIRSAKRYLELKELNSTITQHGKKTHLSISGPNQFFKSNTFLNQPRKLYAS